MTFRGNYREADRPHDAPRDESEIFTPPKKPAKKPAPKEMTSMYDDLLALVASTQHVPPLGLERFKAERLARQQACLAKLTRNRTRDRFDYEDEIARPEDVVRELSAFRSYVVVEHGATSTVWRPGYVPRKEDP